jgi:WD40 repeat protein
MNESGSAIISAAWSPDGKTIALGTENGDLLLYQFQTELLSKVISETNLPINNIEWSPNGKYLAYSDDDLIYFHEFAAGFVTQKFQYPESSITAFAWSPDAKIMAVGFVGNIFLVINVSRADILFSYTELIGPVTNILWSKDGKLILTNSIDGIQYWGIQK